MSGNDERPGGFDAAPFRWHRDDLDRDDVEQGQDDVGHGDEGHDGQGYGAHGRGNPNLNPNPDNQAHQSPGFPDFDPDDDPDFDVEHNPDQQRPPRRRARKLAPLFVCLAGLCALGVFISTSLSGGSSPAKPSGFVPTATDTAQAAGEIGQAFLTAWQSGDIQKAAHLTDDPNDAITALTSYRKDLNLQGLNLAVLDSDGSGNVSFSVAATVGLPSAASASAPAGAASAVAPPAGPGSGPAAARSAVTGVWNYSSSLSASQVAGAQNWLVQWQPTILGANLTSITHLAAVAVAPGVGVVTDDANGPLANSADPGLQKIAGLLAANAPAGQGTPGLDVAVVDADGTPVPGIAPAVLTQPVTSGVLATTIDPKAETAAMAAVNMFPRSSMVVLQPTTGDILAIANNDEDNDDALTAQIAPGSTMKVITSTALLNQGMSTQTHVGCPQTFTVTAVTTQNSGGESEPDDTPFIKDFAASCNNAFTSQYQKLNDGLLAQTTQRYFGLTTPWDIGLGDPSTYFSIPSDSVNSELAAEAFGQGKLLASPLAMASVAATVQTGSFHQPILVPGIKQVSATPLPGETDTELQQMMREVVSEPYGTAYGVGFGSGVYAKTGTADHGLPGTAANSWIIVFDPSENIAIGCVVLGGEFGAQSAGPEAKHVIGAM